MCTNVVDMTIGERVELLKAFLGRYKIEKERIRELQNRFGILCVEAANCSKDLSPADASLFGTMQYDNQMRATEKAITDRICCETEVIRRELDDSQRVICDINHVVGEIPAGTIERQVIEMRYIDGRSWDSIETCGKVAASRRTAMYAVTRALTALVIRNDVINMLADYANEYNAFFGCKNTKKIEVCAHLHP